MDKKELAELIDLCYRAAGKKATVLLADASAHDRLHATRRAPASRSRIDDMLIPPEKESSSTKRTTEVNEIENQYTEGLITDGERYNKVIDIWAQVTEPIAKDMMKDISTDELTATRRNGDREARAGVQPHLHHGRLRRPRLAAADPPARRHARPDGQAVRRDHRDADHGELP